MWIQWRNTKILLQAVSALALLPMAARAAPLDALLTADQFHYQGELRVEAGMDAMNNTLDVLKIRGDDPTYAGTTVGDYAGQHVRLGYALSSKFMLEGGLWRRKISYRADDELIDSWQLAGQYRLLGDADSLFHGAVRISAWGNQSSSLVKNTPTLVQGRTLDSFSIDNLRDSQTQVDAIGTWRLSSQTSLSGFIGFGQGSVTTGNLTGAYVASNGCSYSLSLTPSETFGKLTAPCTAPNAVLAFGTNQSPLSDFSYQSSYVQLGGMWQWQNSQWSLRAGYQYQHLSRDHVDDLIANSGGESFQDNHIVIAEMVRKIGQKTALFVRGQAMSNQFVGEIPFVYNQFTANKFSHRYGLVTIGISAAF